MKIKTYISHFDSRCSRRPHPRAGQRPTPTPRRPSHPQAHQASPESSSPTSTHPECHQPSCNLHVVKTTTRLLVKPIRVRQKERDASPSPITSSSSSSSNDRPCRGANVTIDAVPKQLLARISSEPTLCVRILCRLSLFHDHVHLGASFAGRPTGYVCGYHGEGYVRCESRISSRDKMRAELVDAMGVGMKDGGSKRSGQCRRLYRVETRVRTDGT